MKITRSKGSLLTYDRGGIASCIRFKYVPKLAIGGLEFFGQSQKLAIWSTVEPGLGIMAGSLATLRPMFRSFLRRLGALSYPHYEGYDTDKTNSFGASGPNRSHSNVEDDAILFANPAYLKGNSIDAGFRIAKEPWRPGTRFARTPTSTPTKGYDESIEMHARMVEQASMVEEVANVYDTSRVVFNRPSVPDTAYTRQYYA